jgi:hypothetical protein
MPASEETIRQIIDTYRKAAEANRATPTLRGNVVVLGPADAEEVMITADLHGNRVNYDRILRIADLDAHPRRHLVMQEVCHGGPTYPSGTGCMSHLMLEDVARLKVRYGPRFHFILANHELAELTDYPIVKARRMLNLVFRCGLQEMYGPRTEAIREAYMVFLRSLPLAVRLPHGVFVCHSLPEAVDEQGFDTDVFSRPIAAEDLASDGSVFRLVWGRDFRPANAEAFARLVEAEVLITGHEPCADGYQTPNDRQIVLDCHHEPACYVILNTDRKYTPPQVVDQIQRLA